MLHSLHVKNFAIIDESEVVFRNHLNIMTGETGAGKSILIGSVNAALGAKVSKEVIRQGAEYALVELIFDQLSEQTEATLRQMDIIPEDGMLILSRKIMDSGKSICKINGESVTASVLKEVAELLINIHGQQENQSLLHKAAHLQLLDRFAAEELGTYPEQMKEAYRHYKELKEELLAESGAEGEKNRETAYLEFALEEITAAKLICGEDEELEEEFRLLSNSRQIAETLANCLRYTRDAEDNNAEELLSGAERQLAKIADYNKELSGLQELLSETESMLSEFNRRAETFADSMEDSKERFEEVEERLDLINRLKSKYGRTIEEIKEYAAECEKKLEKYRNYDEYLETLRRNYEKAEQECLTLCKKISDIRKERAEVLTKDVRQALLDLNFSEVKFELPIERTEQFHADGYDACEFMISLNPGEPLKPLVKIASGGELSRIMLAVKSVLADKDEIPTLIFDEIDTGISGRTAQKVSEKLARISAHHQILCITHLAQIAAMADTHFVIEKSAEDGRVKTQIRELTKEETCEELARILGGAKITDTVYENAREMKQLADSYKNY
ncbi:MAG: DNA repair protein RecN [Lachnospiraceae bacterium]